MKQFKKLSELPPNVHAIISKWLVHSEQREVFEDVLGGDVFLAENIEDITECLRNTEHLPNVYDGTAIFCRFINNSGGPTYVVPTYLLKPNPKGHITRYSDSSLYDEVCLLCGTTDGWKGRLDELCPNKLELHSTDCFPL